MRRRGLASRSQLLSVGYVAADEELAWRLDVRPRARVLRIERLRIASEEPMAIETTHLVAARFPGLARRLGGSVSLYELLATEYGVNLAEAEETIETVPGPAQGGRAAQHHRRLPDAAALPAQPGQLGPAGRVRPLVLPG